MVICWRKEADTYVVICKNKENMKFRYIIKKDFTINHSEMITEDDFMNDFITNISHYNLFSEDCEISKRFNKILI
jgi:hypothetical protein